MDVVRFVNKPVFAGVLADPGSFARLVLVEAAKYGMPPATVAMLDEIGALLGLYAPVTENQLTHLAASPVRWNSGVGSPVLETSPDLVRYAQAEKAELAFGQLGDDRHLVGPAEIVLAMGSALTEALPDQWLKVFQWASAHVWCDMRGRVTPAEIAKARGWEFISDDRVLEPKGDLHEIYMHCARSIRRNAIDSVEPEENPRAITIALCEKMAQACESTLAGDPTPEMAEMLRLQIARFRKHGSQFGLGYQAEQTA